MRSRQCANTASGLPGFPPPRSISKIIKREKGVVETAPGGTRPTSVYDKVNRRPKAGSCACVRGVGEDSSIKKTPKQNVGIRQN
eukprot:scaffold6317_cov174-Isochrysis_galbana.AAC.1